MFLRGGRKKKEKDNIDKNKDVFLYCSEKCKKKRERRKENKENKEMNKKKIVQENRIEKKKK